MPATDQTQYPHTVIETELLALMEEADDLRERFAILTHLLLVKRVYRVQALATAMGIIEARLCDPAYIATVDQEHLLPLYRTFQTVWRSQAKYLMAHLDYLADGREEEMVRWFRENKIAEDRPAVSALAQDVRTEAPARDATRSRSDHRISEDRTCLPKSPRRRVAEDTPRIDIRELARAGVFRGDTRCPATLVLSTNLEIGWEIHSGIADTLYLHLTFYDPRPLPDPTLELVVSERGFGKRAAVRCPALIEADDDVQLCRRPCEVLYLVQHPERGWEIKCRRCARIAYRSQHFHRTLQRRFERDSAELERAIEEVNEAAQAELLTGEPMPPRIAQRHRAVLAAVG